MTTFKLVATGVIWFQAIVGGLAPLVLKDHVSPTVTNVLNMFAGGIFLAGSTMHLLPDAQENKALAAVGCMGRGKCLQLAYFFYAVGFLVVLMLEVLAHAIQQRIGDSHEQTLPTVIEEDTPLVIHITQGDRSSQVQPNKVKGILLTKNNHLKTNDKSTPNTNNYGSTSYEGNEQRQNQSTLKRCDNMTTHTHTPRLMDTNPALAVVIFVALSFHSVMEGMGVGAANEAAWDILIAIVAHKSLAAFALALELLHQQVPRMRLVATIGLFSLMSPLGILLGWLLVDATKETVASGICTAMAGGTFLYVAVMETIPQELKNHHRIGLKSMALLTGFVSMGLLSIWT